MSTAKVEKMPALEKVIRKFLPKYRKYTSVSIGEMLARIYSTRAPRG